MIDWRRSREALVEVPIVTQGGDELETEGGDVIVAAVVATQSPIEEDVPDKLLEQFKTKPRIEGLLRALVSGCQPLEDTLHQLATERSIDTAEGAQLDGIGDILGRPRGPLGDDAYRAVLRAQIRVLLSSGTGEELLTITRLIIQDETGARWREFYPASGSMTLLGAPPVDAGLIVEMLQRARMAGVRLLLWYPVDEDTAERPFTFDDADDPGEWANFGFGSVNDPELGGRRVSVKE